MLRDNLGSAISINSAFRTVTYNKSIGSEPNSYHLTVSAADIVVAGLKPSAVKPKTEELIKDGKMLLGGVGLYKSFVHHDIRGTKARWSK